MWKPIRVVAFAVAVLLFSARAFAQDGGNLDDPYLSLGLMLGFAGEAEFDVGSVSAEGLELDGSSASGEADTEISFGGGAQYIHPLHRHFALGARLSLLSWRSDAEGSGDRNLVFDLALVPQVRFPLSGTVELYVSVPLGLSLNLLNELDSSARFDLAAARVSVETDPGFGFNLGVLLGARIALARELGLFTELGYALHSVSHDTHFRAALGGAGFDVSAETDVSFWQLAWNAGVYF